jgi:hypothetical protein
MGGKQIKAPAAALIILVAGFECLLKTNPREVDLQRSITHSSFYPDAIQNFSSPALKIAEQN